MEIELSKQQFARLSQEVNNFLSRYNDKQKYGYEIIFFLLRLGLFCFGLFLFSFDYLWLRIMSMFVLSYAFYGIAITGTHESRHGAFVKSGKINIFIGYLFGDFWSGESSEWWYSHHVRDHHVYTNMPSKEKAYFNFSWFNKYVYFFLIPFFVVPYLALKSCLFLKNEPLKLWRFLFLFVSGFLFHTFLFSFFVSFPIALLLTLIMRSLFAPIFMHLALFNHIGLPSMKDKLSWLPHQTKTTRNVSKNWFLTGMGGNAFVENHIEHHLFPRLSNHCIKLIGPIVRKHVLEAGYIYLEESYYNCLSSCLRNYKKIFV